MIIKQISVLRTVTNLQGEPFNVMLTAELKENEDVGIGILKLKQLIDSKVAYLKPEQNGLAPQRLNAQPSKAQWFKLRLLLIRKKGMKDDEEMFEYVKVRIGTDNLDWVSSDEIDDLIDELEKS